MWNRHREIAARWAGLATASGLGWWLFAVVGVISPTLFAALIAAIVFAVAGIGPSRPPRPATMAAQAMLAVSIGLSMRRETLSALGSHGLVVVGFSIATLLLSVGTGLILGRHRDVDSATGVLSMIAGGATGLIAVAQDLGADGRVVVVAQYLRVALVVLSMPLIVTYGFAAPSTTASVLPVTSGSAVPWWFSIGFMIIVMIAGTGAAMLVRIPVPATLGPLIASASCELAGWVDGIHIPSVVLPIAFLIIGWQAGLSFTRDSLGALGRIFVWALALIVVLTVACAGLGVLLSMWTGISVLDGYLATTPGGLSAVLAVATSTDSDATFVAASQVIRLVMMLCAAPLLVWAITRRHRPSRTRS
ncbi:AbrB family transcriptional regulator [Rhodococcus jostii]|jgi:membrane AbrB-like protein|uniref:AbrB family transcriptional regulator n=2 Tax=Rhodococcus TaxID=1827 RepID=A0ABU4CDZ0_RHOJO|nr:AbrB family transcriptional regulator [Rhodococcus jostii]MDV6281780.1 AbrB family transcriptional regulator [Rhodococcus jostii]